MDKGCIFVISGTSGVGKSTVLAKVMEKRKDLIFSVSATTRAPRPGEKEGVDYYFVTQEQFRKMIDQDEFLEYDAHMNNSYGTPKAQVEEKRKKRPCDSGHRPQRRLSGAYILPGSGADFHCPPFHGGAGAAAPGPGRYLP